MAMHGPQVWLDNLTIVALLTIKSILFPLPHKIIEGLDVLSYPIIISHFALFSEKEKEWEGNYIC